MDKTPKVSINAATQTAQPSASESMDYVAMQIKDGVTIVMQYRAAMKFMKLLRQAELMNPAYENDTIRSLSEVPIQCRFISTARYNAMKALSATIDAQIAADRRKAADAYDQRKRLTTVT